jgi:DNA invertase Pin-like site-specific DNA recombinase
LVELEEYARRNGYNIVLTISETITGSSKKNDRPGLQQIFELASKGQIQGVI